MIDYAEKGLGAKQDKRALDRIKARVESPRPIPDVFNLEVLPPIRDQGSRGACTGFATCFFFEQLLLSRGLLNERLSPSFLWFHGRSVEGNQAIDEGVQMRDAIGSLVNFGTCLFSQYDDSQPLNAEPSVESQEFGKALKLPEAERCNSLQSIRETLAIHRQSAIISIPVYENIYDDEPTKTGDIPPPRGQLVGLHAVAAVGYDNLSKRLKFANSWSETWGDLGYGTILYDVLDSFGFDCHTAVHGLMPNVP